MRHYYRALSYGAVPPPRPKVEVLRASLLKATGIDVTRDMPETFLFRQKFFCFFPVFMKRAICKFFTSLMCFYFQSKKIG